MATDGLGSVRVETQGQNATASKLYNPFGTVLEQYGTSQTTYGYTGEQFNSTSGLLYLRARYYNPATRLFSARDPWSGNAKSPSTFNLYLYAKNNPILYVDYSGWCSGLPSDPPVCWTGSNNIVKGWEYKQLRQQGATYHAPTRRGVPIDIGDAENATIKELLPIAFNAAYFHNRPSKTNMDTTSFTALILSILHWEGRLKGNGKPINAYELAHDQGSDIATRIGPYNGTTGIANITPETAIKILEGKTEGPFGELLGDFCYIVRGSAYPEFVKDFGESQTIITASYPYGHPVMTTITTKDIVFSELQNEKMAIEYLAANLARGADRVTALGYEASVFNLASYHNSGIQTPGQNGYLHPEADFDPSYGNKIIELMPQLLLFVSELSHAKATYGGYYLEYNSEDMVYKP